ncbi:MAG: hypothetical protein GX640_23775 [Fibrobacter sp.]|nr:hypothetical protein [Fibrobacter sp.]
MWIDEIEDGLPNGFHDAIIDSIKVDIKKRIVSVEIEIDISDSAISDDFTYRKGLLKIENFGFFNIENPKSTVESNQAVRITSTGTIVDLLVTDMNSYFFYVPNWNSFIKFTGRTAEFSWV